MGSWANKSGHTRTAEDARSAPMGCDEDNFHADHHTFHRANFGLSTNPLLDFYFGTQGATTKRVEGRSWDLIPLDSGNVKLRVAPVARAKKVMQTTVKSSPSVA